MSYGMRDITDGLSNTIAYSEGIVGHSPAATTLGNMVMSADLSGKAYFLKASRDPSLVTADLDRCSESYSPSNPGAISVGHGHDWSVGSMGATLFNTVVTPNHPKHRWAACRSDCNGACDGASMDYSNAQSYHPGGVNVLMADGSTRFLKNDVSTSVYWAIGSRCDGNMINGNY